MESPLFDPCPIILKYGNNGLRINSGETTDRDDGIVGATDSAEEKTDREYLSSVYVST